LNSLLILIKNFEFRFVTFPHFFLSRVSVSKLKFRVKYAKESEKEFFKEKRLIQLKFLFLNQKEFLKSFFVAQSEWKKPRDCIEKKFS